MKPVIGCTVYRKVVEQDPPLEVHGVMPAYLEAVAAAGGIPLMIPLGLSEPDLLIIFSRIDGLLLPGGGDIDPARYRGDASVPTLYDISAVRDETEIFLARQAVQQAKPLLAICWGNQDFNVALGGTLWEDIAHFMPGAMRHDYYRQFPRNHTPHEVHLTPGTKLAQLLGVECTLVNSLHHQGIRQLGDGLVAAAAAPDGLIEAIEFPDHPFALGVQWHPENLVHDDPKMRHLFVGLVESASHKP
jgi:putative glutamine amidotransferase